MVEKAGIETAESVRGRVLLQIDAALALLEPRRVASDVDVDVHEARKSIKRARAQLRLLRPALSARAFSTGNLALRDAGRALGRTRDAKVLRETLERVAGRGKVPALRARRLREAVGGPIARGASPVLPASQRRRARELLSTARGSTQRARLPDDAGARLADGMARIRRRGRKAMLAARATPTAEALHEWRKQVKNYWHALEAYPDARGARARTQIAAAHRLARLLGDDHDLAVLYARLVGAGVVDEREDELASRLHARRARLQKRAFALGRTLYARGGR